MQYGQIKKQRSKKKRIFIIAAVAAVILILCIAYISGKIIRDNSSISYAENYIAEKYGIDKIEPDHIDYYMGAMPGGGPWGFPQEPDYDSMNELKSAEAAHEYLEKLDSAEVNIEFEITMKDGTKLKAVGITAEIEKNSENDCVGTLHCDYIQDGFYAALNPDEIVSVTVFGQKIFG
ncbi:MAG: hypothetical protein IJ861_05230 [Clostridia bacterium]|nr:hypothetical protein [Clostridia bacterium]